MRPDAVAVPYSFVKSDTVPSPDAVYYEARGKYFETTQSDIYARPDGTQAAYPTGPGAPQGPTSACVTGSVEMALGGSAPSGSKVYCWYKGRALKRREDGQLIYGAWVSPGGLGTTGWYLIDEEVFDNQTGGSTHVIYHVGTGAVAFSTGWGGRCYASGTDPMESAFQGAYGL